MSETSHPARRAALRLLPALALAALLAPPAAESQEPAGTRGIAVVDAGRIFRESQVGQQLLEDLKVLRESKREEREQREAEAQELRNRITQGRLSLSAEKLEELEKELEDRLIALERFDSDTMREIDKASEEAMSRFNNRIMPVIETVGGERGLTLIFNKFEAGLLFAHDQIDITEQVIERFDAMSAEAETAAADGGADE